MVAVLSQLVIVLMLTETMSEHLYESSWAIFFDDAVLLFEICLSRCYPMKVLGRCLLIRSAGSIMAAASSKLLFFSGQVLMIIGEAPNHPSRQQQVKLMCLECNILPTSTQQRTEQYNNGYSRQYVDKLGYLFFAFYFFFASDRQTNKQTEADRVHRLPVTIL